MASNLTQRIAFAVIAIPIALGVVYVGGWLLVAVVAAAGALGARELYDFAERQGIEPLRRTGLVSAALLPVGAYLNVTHGGALEAWGWFLAGLWLVVVLGVALWRRLPSQRPFAATSATLFGVLYPAGLATFLIPIRHGAHGLYSWAGAWMVFTPLVVTWIGDSVAMAGGKAIGGPKLWPAISPGKTWAGSVTGLGGAIATPPLLNLLILERVGVALPLTEALLFGLVLGIVGQVGDLAESLYKREVGVKDSSSLIPGHGGVLDRFDSLYFVLPFAAAMYRLFGRI
jgi:phosphatidate cytidylyltransferase